MTQVKRLGPWLPAMALFLSGCAMDSYVSHPTPIGLVEVLSGQSNEQRTASVEHALSAFHIPYRDMPYGGGVNLVVDRGTKGPVFLITAHTDRRPGSPGANDNASCVSALVQAILETPVPQHITLRFLFAGGEKSNSAGSRHYAGNIEAADLAGVVTFDLCGIGDTALAWDVTEEVGTSTIFRALKGAAQDLGLPQATHGTTDRFYNDHLSFAVRGIPAFAVNMVPQADVAPMLHILSHPDSPEWTQKGHRPRMFQFYKSAEDRPGTLDPASLTQVVRLITALSRRLDKP